MRYQCWETQLLINNLTDNEDYRQELWVHYLSGNSSLSFAEKLKQIHKEQVENQQVADAIAYLLNSPETSEFRSILSDFSELEQSIMCLLALGMSVPEISKYKTLSIIRVQQVVTTIRNHTKWNEAWHLNETLQTKKNTALRKKK